MDNADALRRVGLVVPRLGFDEDFMLGGHVNIARELSGDILFNPRFGTLDDVVAKLRDAQVPNALLTSELFEFLYEDPKALERLRLALSNAGYDVRVIVYLRSRERYIESLYLQMLRHGFDCPFDEYLSYILRHGQYDSTDGFLSFQFEYRKILESFSAVFGKHNLIIKRYGDHFGQAFLNDFLQTIGISNVPGTELIVKENENESLSFFDALTLLFENAKSYAGAVGPHPQELLQQRGDVPAWMPFSVLDGVDRAHIAMRFAADRIELQERFGITVILLEASTGLMERKARRSILRDAAQRWGLADYRSRCAERYRAGMLPANVVEAAAMECR